MEQFLRDNFKVFAWSTVEIPGISFFIISHSLNVNLIVKPVKQKKRKFSPDQVEAMKQKIEIFFKPYFIREVHYPDCLSNIVMVKKASGKWKMCVDFTNLNKADFN